MPKKQNKTKHNGNKWKIFMHKIINNFTDWHTIESNYIPYYNLFSVI